MSFHALLLSLVANKLFVFTIHRLYLLSLCGTRVCWVFNQSCPVLIGHSVSFSDVKKPAEYSTLHFAPLYFMQTFNLCAVLFSQCFYSRSLKKVHFRVQGVKVGVREENTAETHRNYKQDVRWRDNTAKETRTSEKLYCRWMNHLHFK